MKRQTRGRKNPRASLLGLVAALGLLALAVWRGGLPGMEQGRGEPAFSSAQGKLQVYFLDVGQGDSQLIRIPQEEGYYTILLDTGEHKYAENLVDYLRELGVDALDELILSHPHSDHMGGAAKVLQELPVSRVCMPILPEEQTPTTASYEKLITEVTERSIPVKRLYSGVELEVPGMARLRVLAPEKEAVWEDANHYSAVMKLTYGETGFLFTGDAEKANEKQLLQGNADLSAQVLKCGHHGSNTSTTAEFLKAVAPEYGVISCGVDNKYGHPNSGTLKKLELVGAQVYRTDEDATLLAVSDGENLEWQKNLASVKENKN